MFAFNSELPVFFSEPERPFRFDFVEPGIDLSCVRLENTATVLRSFDREKIVGMPKEILWERLMFYLSYLGNAPMANMCNSMRYTGNGIVFSDEYAKIAEITFNHCYYFGDKSCFKLLDSKTVDFDNYICYDWIAFNRGGKHDVDYIETEDDFVRTIWFYHSDRMDNSRHVKDACVVSYLKREQIEDFDFSETMARFKLVHEMYSRGMKGKFSGSYSANGNPKYYKYRTTHITRRVCENIKEARATDSTIEIACVSEKDLYSGLQPARLAYGSLLKYL